MEGIMTPQKLPQTDSIQELTQFWDTHDLTDFEEELEEVAEPIFERAATLTLRLEQSEAEAVKRMAESQGVADVDLIRGWVLEKISSS
jgi:predicted DNA binding CopG/RHH family protein